MIGGSTWVLLREMEADLGGRGLDGDAVPADASAAHLVDVIPEHHVLGLVGDVPGEGGDQD